MSTAQSDEMSEDEAALHIMVLYDDLDAGVFAREIYAGIRMRLPEETEAKLSLWRIDLIDEGRTERLARADLAEADVLIIAADGTQSLPQRVEKILEKWLLAKGAAGLGLVGILHGVEEKEKEFSPVHSYLDDLAKTAKIEFFSQAVASPAEKLESSFINARRPLNLDFVWDEDSFSRPVSIARWGINE